MAKNLSDTVATLGQAVPRGTQQYMAPEQYKPISDPVSPANDVADGVAISGLVVHLGNDSSRTPAQMELPIGSSVVTVEDPRFQGSTHARSQWLHRLVQ